MLTAIREKAEINGGRIEMPLLDYPNGTEVEVIVLVDADVEDEMDTTDYLLSTEANRKYFAEALEELKHPEKFIPVDIENL